MKTLKRWTSSASELNTYLAFIESGELQEQYPKAKGRTPQISIVFKHPPSKLGSKFLERVAAIVTQAGVTFDFETVPV